MGDKNFDTQLLNTGVKSTVNWEGGFQQPDGLGLSQPKRAGEPLSENVYKFDTKYWVLGFKEHFKLVSESSLEFKLNYTTEL